MFMFPIYTVSIANFNQMNLPYYSAMIYLQFILAALYLMYAAAAFAATHKWRLMIKEAKRRKEMLERERIRHESENVSLRDILAAGDEARTPKEFV